MNISKIASAAYNNIISGLAGYEATANISIQQLEDEICEERLNLAYQLYLKNTLPVDDLYASLNCIQVDCDYIGKCCAIDQGGMGQTKVAHFVVPPIAVALKEKAVRWVGSVDHLTKFKVFFSEAFRFNKYNSRRKDKPYVYIDPTVNSDGMMDGYIFNAPMLERLSITAIFKDDRKLEEYDCCSIPAEDNLTILDASVKDSIVKKYINYYRQLYVQPQSNTQIPGPTQQ